MKTIIGLCAYLILFVVAFSNYGCQRDAGGMRLTDDSTQYIKYTIAGNSQNFLSPFDSFRTVRRNGEITIFGHPFTMTDSASWQFTAFNITDITAPGAYPLIPRSFVVTKGIPPKYNVQFNDDGPITVTITEFGNMGGYIAGNFTGSLRAWTNSAIVSGSCEFRIKRSF